MDAELVGEERDRSTHPKGLMRSNVIGYRFSFVPRMLHARHAWKVRI